MTFIYPAVFSPKKDGKGYHVEFPDLACCEADGPDLEDALENASDAAYNCQSWRKRKTVRFPQPARWMSWNRS